MNDSLKVMIRLSVILLLMTCHISAEPSASWSRFRGPDGSGVAAGCRPPVKFGKETEAWRVKVPSGLSFPVLSKKTIFLTAEEEGELLTLAFDKKTGKELWRRSAPVKTSEKIHRAPESTEAKVNEDLNSP